MTTSPTLEETTRMLAQVKRYRESEKLHAEILDLKPRRLADGVSLSVRNAYLDGHWDALFAASVLALRSGSNPGQGTTEAREQLAQECKQLAEEALCEAESAGHPLNAAGALSRLLEARVELFAAIDRLRDLSATEAAGWSVPPNIAAMIEQLHTQDNRITANPLFAVQERHRIYGLDPDRSDDVVWLDESNDYREATPDEFAAMEAIHDMGDEPKGDWYRTGYIDVWKFVTGGFTEQGCKDYIRRNGHNLKEPRIYAYGSYRNDEFTGLRDWLMSLRAPTAPGASQEPKETP